MREIKFRAWHNCKMYEWEWLDEQNNILHCLWTALNSQKHKDCEPVMMQFTGLKDKNGVEIYEGDVLECDYTNHHLPPYSDCGGSPKHNMVVKYTITDKSISFTIPLHAEVTVMGSVYENPELLK